MLGTKRLWCRNIKYGVYWVWSVLGAKNVGTTVAKTASCLRWRGVENGHTTDGSSSWRPGVWVTRRHKNTLLFTQNTDVYVKVSYCTYACSAVFRWIFKEEEVNVCWRFTCVCDSCHKDFRTGLFTVGPLTSSLHWVIILRGVDRNRCVYSAPHCHDRSTFWINFTTYAMVPGNKRAHLYSVHMRGLT